jgi:antitoxin ParD1/3/4
MTLAPEIAAMVEEKVRSGQYHSANEVLREGLRLLEERDHLRQMRQDQLRREIAVGIMKADAGESAPLDMEAIKTEGRRRLAERTGTR